MTTQFPVAPTYAEPVIIDSITDTNRFNPIWLKWFLDVAAFISQSGGGGGGGIDHNTLASLQGGDAGASEFYHLDATEHGELTNAKSIHLVYAGPSAGAPAIPAFRLLVASDLPAGTGTVTSVASGFTGGLISVAGSPITTSGTLAFTVAGTSGGIPYFSGAATWASSGLLTANAIVLGGGAGTAPTVISSLGTAGQVLTSAGVGMPPSWQAPSGFAAYVLAFAAAQG